MISDEELANLQSQVIELEKAKSKAEEEKAQAEVIIRSIGSGLIVTKQKDSVLIINEAACIMLGWKAEEAIGRPVTEIAPVEYSFEPDKANPNSPGSALSLISSARNRGTTTFYLKRKDGTSFPAEIITSSVIFAKEITGTVIVFSDRTEEMRINREKSDFVAIASHQLRTPLGSMKWNLEMLRNGDFGQLPAGAHEVLDQVWQSNVRMMNLVGDLLTVSRIDQGRVVYSPEKVDILPIISQVVLEIGPIASKKDIKVEFNTNGLVKLETMIDKKRITEVIMNLLSNGIKYNRQGGQLRIDLKLDSRKILIDISDQGIGISPSAKDRIFTKFFRADNAIKNDTEGTGLGLYVVKNYVESFKGKIGFESEEGKGSTFHLEIPVVS